MARIMEIFVIVNAACGIAAFVIAKGAIKRAKRKLGLDERPAERALPSGRRDPDVGS